MNAFVTLPTIGVFIALVLYRLWDSFRHGLKWPHFFYGQPRYATFPWEEPNAHRIYVVIVVLIYTGMVILRTAVQLAFIVGILFCFHILHQ
jgi:hypothetical protein